MARDFADEYREADERGVRQRFVFRALIDVLATAPVELARALGQDLQHALRIYRNGMGSTATAVGVLAVGVAFLVAFLSLYIDLSLRPHVGFEQGSQIATIGSFDGSADAGIPYAALERMADEMTSIEAAAMVSRGGTLIGPTSEPAATAFVSNGFFDGLRPRLALGRGFTAEEHAPDAEPVVVLSYQYWRQRFGGDPNVLGTSLEITRDPNCRPASRPNEPEPESLQYRIVGVIAESLADIPYPKIAIWLPIEPVLLQLVTSATFQPAPEVLSRISGRSYIRQSADVSVQAVLNEFNTRYSDENSLFELSKGFEMDAIAGIVPSFAVHRDTLRQLELFLASSLLLAFVTAVNVSLHFLARAPGRRRELGIRLAVGAPLRRLVRQLATESALLVSVAAALGLLLSLWLTTSLRGLPLMREADWRDPTLLDWRVLGAAAVVVVVLALVVSLAPIMGLRRLGIAASSQHATARASRAQRLAGTAQIAVAGAIGGAAIAFGWYLGSLMFGDKGYELTDRYLGWSGPLLIDVKNEATFVELARRREAIEAIPGVVAVAFGWPVPSQGTDGRPVMVVPHPDDPAQTIDIRVAVAEQEYVDLLGLSILHGRAPDFESGDTTGVLVNQTLARAFWGRDDVVGEHLPPGLLGGHEVIGVLEDVPFGHPVETVPPIAWAVIGGGGPSAETVIHAQLTPAELQQELNRIFESGAIEPPVISLVEPLQAEYDELTAPDRARGFMTMAAAIMIVLLTAFGFYGTQRYLVAAWRREYAIRGAIGAGPRALGRLVFRRGIQVGLPGLVSGALLAFVVVAWLRNDLLSREISPVFVTVCVVAGLVLLLLAATAGPAREAARTQVAPLLREN